MGLQKPICRLCVVHVALFPGRHPTICLCLAHGVHGVDMPLLCFSVACCSALQCRGPLIAPLTGTPSATVQQPMMWVVCVPTLLNSQVDEAGHKGVLRGAVDEGNALQDGSCCIDAGGGDLALVIVNCRQKGLCGVVEALSHLAVALCIGCPEHNHPVHLHSRLPLLQSIQLAITLHHTISCHSFHPTHRGHGGCMQHAQHP